MLPTDGMVSAGDRFRHKREFVLSAELPRSLLRRDAVLALSQQIDGAGNE